jgi:ankyrin repeat protein
MEHSDTLRTLEIAIRCNDVQLLKKLIEEGVDINTTKEKPFSYYDIISLSPLCIAIEVKNNEIIRELISAGVDLSISHTHGISEKMNCFRNLLINICTSNDTSLLSLLLSKGFNPNQLMKRTEIKRPWCGNDRRGGIQKRFEMYPLNLIVSYGTSQLASILLKSGANIQQEAIFSEIYNGQIRPTIFHPNLFLAIEKKNYDMIKLLLEYNADPNKKYLYSNDINSHLQYALSISDFQLTYLLIRFGANPDFEYLEKMINNKKEHGEKIKNEWKLLKLILKKEFSPDIFKYYPKQTQISIAWTVFTLGIKCHRIKHELALYIIKFMI